MKTELKSIYDSRKSFYGKAYYELTEEKQHYNIYTLYSYNTPVMRIEDWSENKNCSLFIINKNINEKLLYSNTTLRHMKEFIKQFIPYYRNVNLTKKDIDNIGQWSAF